MQALYLALLGFLAAHELDAVACREWRLLYVLRRMPEAVAQAVFIACHVPLFAGLAWTAATDFYAAGDIRVGVAVFAIVHAGLHYRLQREPEYAFHSPLSISLIAGAAACGMVYAVLSMQGGS